MKLMSVKEYCQTRYTAGSRPSTKRIVKLIRDGVIPGLQQGKLFYVDLDAEERQQIIPKDDLVTRVLQARRQQHAQA